MTPSLRHLRIIRDIGRTGSAAKAAGETRLTQPAVTQAVAGLERLLGVRLFDRRPQGLLPTPEGLRLISRIDRALSVLDPALADLAPRLVMTATLAQLQALVAVVEAESFSEAARRLSLAQPTVHRAVAQIEGEAGRSLFDRTSHGVIATRPAQRLAMAARLMQAEMDQAWAELAEGLGREVGRIVIGGMPLSRSSLLGPAIARFRQARPTLRIRVVEGPFRDLLLGLRRGEIDFLIGALRPKEAVPDLAQEALLEDRMAVVCRPGHPAEKASNPKALTGYLWVVSPEGTPARAAFSALFPEPPASLVETGSLILMRELLRQSDHLGFVSALQVAPEIALGALAAVPVALGDAPRTIGILTRQDWQPTRAQADMLEALRAIAGAARAGVNGR
jgi:LysR family transcriptional regulator, regulator for genes of the gallate degradation pathway